MSAMSQAADQFLDAAGESRGAFRHQDHPVGKPDDLAEIVGHIDDRDAEAVPQLLDEGNDLVLALRIQRGQWLVHQQQLRAGQQRAADGDPLFLAAGEIARAAVQQLRDVKQRDNFVEADAPFLRRDAAVAEQQIVAHAEMGKQAAFLEHIAEAPLFGRHRQACGAVEQHGVADLHIAAVGLQQPRQETDHGTLAGAGTAEQRGDAGAGHADIQLQMEAAKTVIGAERQHGLVSEPRPQPPRQPFRRHQRDQRQDHGDDAEAERRRIAVRSSGSACRWQRGSCGSGRECWRRR